MIPNEGLQLIADFFITKDATERGTDFDLMVITNSSVSASTVYADLTEFSGVDYARIVLTDASWTRSFDGNQYNAEYAAQTFTAGTGGWSGFTGFAVVTKDADPQILSVQLKDSPGTPYSIGEGDPFEVTPKIGWVDGTP